MGLSFAAQPLESGAPKQLTGFAGERIFWFDFSRDVRRLGLSRGTQTSDLIVSTDFSLNLWPSPLAQKLGRYEVRAKIGEGGMGEVYLAQDTKLDRKVALKVLPADVAAHPATRLPGWKRISSSTPQDYCGLYGGSLLIIFAQIRGILTSSAG